MTLEEEGCVVAKTPQHCNKYSLSLLHGMQPLRVSHLISPCKLLHLLTPSGPALVYTRAVSERAFSAYPG